MNRTGTVDNSDHFFVIALKGCQKDVTAWTESQELTIRPKAFVKHVLMGYHCFNNGKSFSIVPKHFEIFVSRLRFQCL